MYKIKAVFYREWLAKSNHGTIEIVTSSWVQCDRADLQAYMRYMPISVLGLDVVVQKQYPDVDNFLDEDGIRYQVWRWYRNKSGTNKPTWVNLTGDVEYKQIAFKDILH